jgi:hypothetical protein
MAGRAAGRSRRERPGRWLGHAHDRALRQPCAGPGHRSGSEPARPAPVPGTEHDNVAAAREAGEFRGDPAGEDGLFHRDVTGQLAGGLSDGRLDQHPRVGGTIRIAVPDPRQAALARVQRGMPGRTVEVDQQQPRPAPPRFPDRPGERPPARPRTADTDHQPGRTAGPARVVHALMVASRDPPRAGPFFLCRRDSRHSRRGGSRSGDRLPPRLLAPMSQAEALAPWPASLICSIAGGLKSIAPGRSRRIRTNPNSPARKATVPRPNITSEMM